MALEQTEWYYDYIKDSELTVRLARDRLARIGSASSDAVAWNSGYARLWLDDPANPYVYGHKIEGATILSGPNQRAEQTNSWVEYTPEEKRAELQGMIDSQVFQADGTQLVEDAMASRAIESTSGGASERRSDLEDTPDGDLDTFDPLIVATPADGAGVIEAKQVATIEEVEPWAGAPNDIYALVVYLEVMSDTGDEGVEARAHMFGPKDGPAGAVMPFERDSVNPKRWRSQSQIGRYWENPAETASMRLFWANGSIPVDSTKELSGRIGQDGRFHSDRDYSVVRYGG